MKMKYPLALALAFGSLAALSAPSVASAAGLAGDQYDSSDPRNCPARGQPGRTKCLEDMNNRGKADSGQANAELERLNRRMEIACDAAQTADAAARVAARSPYAPARWSGRVFSSARALTDFALGQRRECDKLRRELRGR